MQTLKFYTVSYKDVPKERILDSMERHIAYILGQELFQTAEETKKSIHPKDTPDDVAVHELYVSFFVDRA